MEVFNRVKTARKDFLDKTMKKALFGSPQIGNTVFKLHYLFSCWLLFTCATIASIYYVKNSINCVEHESFPKEFLNSWCFVRSTYILDDQKPTLEPKITYYGDAHPGVAPLDNKTQTVNYKKYYMWVWFTLFIQMVLFYCPYYLWKCLENGRIKKLVELTKPPEPKKEDDENEDEEKVVLTIAIGQVQAVYVQEEIHFYETICAHSALEHNQSDLHEKQQVEEEPDIDDFESAVSEIRSEDEDDKWMDLEDPATKRQANPEYGHVKVDMVPYLSLSTPHGARKDAVAREATMPSRSYASTSTTISTNNEDNIEEPVPEESASPEGTEANPDTDDQFNLQGIVYDFKYHLNHNDAYFGRFMFCELLNLVNLIVQLYFMDYLLGYEFGFYGLRVAAGLWEQDPEERQDVFARIFPKVAKCGFSKYGPGGNIVNYDGLCVLPMNAANEQIYAILWFWFIILFALTALSILVSLVTWVSSNFRSWLLLRHYTRNKSVQHENWAAFLSLCGAGDWLQLKFLRHTLEEVKFVAFLNLLSEQVLKDVEKSVKVTVVEFWEATTTTYIETV